MRNEKNATASTCYALTDALHQCSSNPKNLPLVFLIHGTQILDYSAFLFPKALNEQHMDANTSYFSDCQLSWSKRKGDSLAKPLASDIIWL